MRNKQLNKGKQVSSPEVLDIDYSIMEYMKKDKQNISILYLSKVSSQQELTMKAWKENIECFVEEKGDVVVNLNKHITTPTNGKETSMIVVFKKFPTSLNNTIFGRK